MLFNTILQNLLKLNQIVLIELSIIGISILQTVMEPQTLDSDSHGESRLTSSSFAIRLGWSTQPENAGHLGSMLITCSKRLRARESDGEKAG